MDGYESKLRELADVRVGYQARGRIDENLNGDFTIIRSQDYDDAKDLKFEEAMRFFPSPKIDPKKYLVSAGDILVQARGQSHLAYLIVEPLENTVAANTFYIIRITDQTKVAPAYLAWWINQPIVQAHLHQHQGKSTVPFISKSALQDCLVQIPPFETQEKIAGAIYLLEQERRLTNRLIEKKDVLVQAFCRTAVMNSGKE